jgi:LPXTG-motif cell wall-anchored protein
MNHKRLASVALAVTVTGVGAVLAPMAWAAAAPPPLESAIVTGSTSIYTTHPPTSYTTRPSHSKSPSASPSHTHSKSPTPSTTPPATTTTAVPSHTTTTTTTTTAPPSLPVTGSTSGIVAIVGAAFIAVGAAMIGWLRRRREG